MSSQSTLPSPVMTQPKGNHRSDKEMSSHKIPEGSDRFIRGMLEMPSIDYKRRNPAQMAASVLIHAGVIAALVIVPGYFVAKVAEQPPKEVTLVFTPPAPTPPPPAAARAAARRTQHEVTPTPQVFKAQPLTAPTEIPKSVETASNAQASNAPDLGILGGEEGGSPDGVLGGILGGTGTGPAAPAAPKIVTVGGNVKRPELLKRVEPDYPYIAKISHIDGTVDINAVIDPQGNVVQEHAVDGPAVLIPAALDAVRQWKYAPTYLDGKPVALNMEVAVTFNLNS